MRLTSLELFGFKSFNQKTEILFPKRITGIVGPNGSGKSNIADAVRWVLGEQNPRLLRGGKMEDVIFNGTQKKKPMNYCEVSLLFDNNDKTLHPDYKEIMVTRRVYRSGDSEYEINKTPCRLKDIVEMFSDTGIGKEGYSIISQGRIDEILSRNTEDRRAVFEEAAGISYYKIQKREAENRLRRAEENLQRINDIADEQQNLLEPLRLQAEAAKSYLALSSSLKEISASIFLFEYDRLSSRKNTLNNNYKDVSDELENYEISLNELKNSTENLQELSSSLEEECSNAAENTILAEREYSKLKEDYTSLNTKAESLGANLVHYKAELSRIAENEAKLNDEISKGSSGKEEAKKLLDSVSHELKKTEDKYNKLLVEVNSLSTKSEELKTKLMDTINASSITESGRSRQKAIKEQMQIRCKELKELQLKTKTANEDIYNNYKNTENSLNEEKTRLIKLKENSDKINNDLETVIFNIREKRSAAQECSEHLSSITSKHKTMTDMAYDFEGYAYAVKHALTIARNKDLSGVYGTVANIIQVPKEYETAIDMVLGGSLQNIVTENEDDAKLLINELRTRQAGRATFLPISSVKSFNINSADRKYLNNKGCIGIASDLLKYDNKYKGIIENLLGKTLVVETLQDGIDIRRAGCTLRMVTLQGDVLHSGGSMTGGSVKANTGSLLARERIIAELSEEINIKKSELDSLNRQYTQYQADRAIIENNRKEIEQLLHDQEIVIARISEKLISIKNDIDDYLGQDQETEDAIEQLEHNIADIDAQLQNLEEQSGKTALDTENLNKEIEKISLEYENKNELCENLREELTLKKLEHSDVDHIYKQLLKDELRTTSDLEESNKLKETISKQLAETEVTLIDLNASININKTEQMGAKEKSELAIKNQKSLESKRQDTNKKLRMQQEEEGNIRQAQMKAVEKQHRLELQIQNVQSEQKSLSENLWNRFELSYSNAEQYRVENNFDISKATKQQNDIQLQIRDLGTVNVNAVEEYNDLKTRNDQLVIQRDDLLASIKDINSLISKLVKNMEIQFVENFTKLKNYFSITFTRLFGGGQCDIELTDISKPLDCGIDIVVQPPGKKKQLLSLFSGGERALTAIALIFAMLMLRPSPFCVFDEIDAALDDANINYFADYLKEFSSNTQFIVVTHRKGTMERCDSLYGVTMAEKGVSTMLSIDLSTYEEELEA